MAKFRRLTGKEVIDLLAELGYEVVRIKGSHHQLKWYGERCFTTVPVHGNQALPIGTLKTIYRQVVACVGAEKADPLFYE